jgi:hypothetical protein
LNLGGERGAGRACLGAFSRVENPKFFLGGVQDFALSAGASRASASIVWWLVWRSHPECIPRIVFVADSTRGSGGGRRSDGPGTPLPRCFLSSVIIVARCKKMSGPGQFWLSKNEKGGARVCSTLSLEISPPTEGNPA